MRNVEYIKVNQFSDPVPIEREFTCRYCGVPVKVLDKKDKRIVYCSQKCEKQYWRDMSKKSASLSKRGRETSHLRNYSAVGMAKKLWKEKKEAEETESIGGKK